MEKTSGSRWAPPEQPIQSIPTIFPKCFAEVGYKTLVEINFAGGQSPVPATSFPKSCLVLSSSGHHLHFRVSSVFGTDGKEGPGQDICGQVGDQMWVVAVRTVHVFCSLLMPEQLLKTG